MPQDRQVAVLVGSLRKESLNRKVAHAMAGLAPGNLHFDFVEYGDLQPYNEDVENAGAPPEWRRFRDAIRPKDAVLFVTPEYNRSMPGAFKNAIDVGSRPYGQSVWNGKPTAVATASPGSIGGFGANHHLRQSLVFLNMPVMQQPEAYIGHANTLFAPDGSIADDKTRAFFQSFVDGFVGWIETILG